VTPATLERPAGSEISDPLAERLCDMLDVFGEIDLPALDRKIERLTRLRDTLRLMRGRAGAGAGAGAGTPVAVPVAAGGNGDVEDGDEEPDGSGAAWPQSRRPRGYWRRAIEPVLAAAGPMSHRQVHDELVRRAAATPGEVDVVYQALASNRQFARVPDSVPVLWELARGRARAGPAREAAGGG
jgi:hypothetical protein